jgi:hypothetical protein
MLDLTTRDWIEVHLRFPKTITIGCKTAANGPIFIVTRANDASGKTILQQRRFHARRYKDR